MINSIIDSGRDLNTFLYKRNIYKASFPRNNKHLTSVTGSKNKNMQSKVLLISELVQDRLFYLIKLIYNFPYVKLVGTIPESELKFIYSLRKYILEAERKKKERGGFF